MKKFALLGVISAATTSAVVSAAILSAGVANADDSVVGQKFSDAKSTLSRSGKTVKVTSIVGGSKTRDDCIVTGVTNASTIDGFGSRRSPVAQVSLNCEADKTPAAE